MWGGSLTAVGQGTKNWGGPLTAVGGRGKKVAGRSTMSGRGSFFSFDLCLLQHDFGRKRKGCWGDNLDIEWSLYLLSA